MGCLTSKHRNIPSSWSHLKSFAQLPSLYEEILNHPNTSDEHRRQIESRLLRRRQEYLFTLPTSGELSSQKGLIASQLREQVDGMVLIGIPDELAWNIYIESADVHSIGRYFPWGFHFLFTTLISLLRGLRYQNFAEISRTISKCVFGFPLERLLWLSRCLNTWVRRGFHRTESFKSGR